MTAIELRLEHLREHFTEDQISCGLKWNNEKCSSPNMIRLNFNWSLLKKINKARNIKPSVDPK